MNGSYRPPEGSHTNGNCLADWSLRKLWLTLRWLGFQSRQKGTRSELRTAMNGEKLFRLKPITLAASCPSQRKIKDTKKNHELNVLHGRPFEHLLSAFQGQGHKIHAAWQIVKTSRFELGKSARISWAKKLYTTRRNQTHNCDT